MRAFLARLFFYVRIALEKSILILWGRKTRLPSNSFLILQLPPVEQDLNSALAEWDETTYPYFIPYKTSQEFTIRLNQLLQGTKAEIIYFDHAIQDPTSPPFLKPIWSPELWLNVDILFAAAFRADFVKRLSAQSGEKLIPRAVLSANQIEHFPLIVLQTDSFPWQDARFLLHHRQTVQDYLDLLGVPAPEIDIRPNGSLRFTWQKSDQPVSVIIPNRNNFALLKRCIESIYENTSLIPFEVLVIDDHSSDPRLIEYYQTLQKERPNFRVIEGRAPFNFSYACNQGARHAAGDYLLFLNNDTEILSPDWLQNLVGIASLPGVGAVGAKLLYPNGRVQHAGVVIGLEGHASHVFQGVKGDPFTPYGYVDWMRNVSAVTAACMLVRKAAFWEVGGFDEQFQIAFGDIDFCLRLRDVGYRIVYTPDVILIHHEGKSRGRYIPPPDLQVKADTFLQKVAEGDPYYHPALSRAWRFPSLRWRGEFDPAERLQKIIQYFD